VSPALDEFVLKCLSRNVRARFQTVESAVEALDRCIEPAPAERRRSRGLWRPLLGVAVLAAAGAGTLVHLAWRLTAADAPESVEAPTAREPVPDPASTPPESAPPAGPAAALKPERRNEPHEHASDTLAGAPADSGEQRETPPAPAQRPHPPPARPPRSLESSRADSEPAASPERSVGADATPRREKAAGRDGAPATQGVRPSAATDGQPVEDEWEPKQAPDFLL
jgi:hypothetical protein